MRKALLALAVTKLQVCHEFLSAILQPRYTCNLKIGFFISHVFPSLHQTSHLTAKIMTPYTLYQTGSAVHLPVLMEYVWTTRTPLTVTVLTLLTLALTVSMLDVSYFRGVQFGLWRGLCLPEL